MQPWIKNYYNFSGELIRQSYVSDTESLITIVTVSKIHWEQFAVLRCRRKSKNKHFYKTRVAFYLVKNVKKNWLNNQAQPQSAPKYRNSVIPNTNELCLGNSHTVLFCLME